MGRRGDGETGSDGRRREEAGGGGETGGRWGDRREADGEG
jgi:hypothetical protein